MNINFRDPLIVLLAIVAVIILLTRILPMFFSLAATLFWIALFAGIVLYINPSTRGTVEAFLRRIFKS